MTKINILSPLVADMIAAGEVVERPASVIKELMENSFDAGAKKVTVEFKSGGATYIRISDDGCGMSPDDAGVAFTRHATSKLRDAEGLSSIGTMGFRGEALAAIAAVSHIELLTREKGSDTGVRVEVSAGDIMDMSPCGCPEGTTITVRDIFHNTPARLKFLKSDRSEASACVAAALRCALGRPEVSVRCLRDGQEEFFTPGDTRTDSTVYSLLGRDIANAMLPVSSEAGGVSVEGFSSSPTLNRGNRNMQFFFCNGRYIKSALLQAAVEQAYKNTLLPGRFPACVLYLNVKPSAVDVNVHPAKTEVKFSEEKQVFDLVYQAVKASLDSEQAPLEIKLSEGTQKSFARPSQDFFKTASAQEYRRGFSAPKQTAESFSRPAPAPSFRSSPAPVKATAEKMPAPTIEQAREARPRVIGEALSTYILVELGSELLLIDKHAAHERMIFDRLKKQGRQIMSQSLIVPVIAKLSPEDAEICENNASLLASLGFEVEAYGEDSVAVRAVPDGVDAADAEAAVAELCRKIAAGKAPDESSARDELLHTVACKAAIKAGKNHGFAELERIAAAVVSGAVTYCPHGRPVSVRLTKKELDKFFSRIV